MITCEFENGSKNSLRHAVVDSIIYRDGKILMAKRAKNMAKEPGKYALPGGFVDRNETVKQTAMRETKEETGYEAIKAEFLFVITNPDRSGDDRQNIAFVYQVDVGEKVTDFDGEVEEIKWFDINDLPPKEEIAFDHLEMINIFIEHKLKGGHRPIIFD
ncbi:NUDIX hydrolase [Patescibacteria group bacterium]|nr:NUDIX hydrolase [Patescibacteria group bacterium]